MPFFDVQNGQTTGDQSLWNQFTDAFTGAQDADIQLFSKISAPAAPTVSVNTTAGNLTGNYQYALAFETGYWQGPVGSGTLHVANNTGGGAASTTISPNGQQATVNIPSAPTGVVNVLVYRTKANGSTFYYLTAVQANTSTQITDNELDSALGAQMPTTNTTGGKFIGDGSQLTNLPIPTPANATTTTPGLVEVSAPPASGQNPVAVATTDANWSKLTGGTTSVADSEHTHQVFPDSVTFNGGATVPSGETLTVAGTETVTGTLQASGSGVINATELNGQPASYYATASSVPTNPVSAVSGGKKIQSGYISNSGLSNPFTVTFPTAFTATPVVLVNTVGAANGDQNFNSPFSISTTGFSMTGGYNSATAGFSWIAIGN